MLTVSPSLELGTRYMLVYLLSALLGARVVALSERIRHELMLRRIAR